MGKIKVDNIIYTKELFVCGSRVHMFYKTSEPVVIIKAWLNHFKPSHFIEICHPVSEGLPISEWWSEAAEFLRASIINAAYHQKSNYVATGGLLQ